MTNEELMKAMSEAIAANYENISKSLVVSEEWIEPAVHEDEDSGDDYEASVDIVDRLRVSTPCVTCQETCREAALEIERYRSMSPPMEVKEGDIMTRLNAAIFDMRPCGDHDCVVPGVHFMRELRDEIARLRVIEARAVSLSQVAKRVWRGESKSLLLPSSLSFDSARGG